MVGPPQDWRGAFLVLLGPDAFQRRHDEKVDAKRPELINWFVVDCCLDALSEYGSHFRLGPHAKCCRHDRRVLRCGENLLVPTSRTIAAAISTDSYSSAPLFASPGNDVFDTGSDLPRFATTVRLSGGSGRFACCRAGFYFNRSCKIRSMRDLWYGFSMSGARSIYSMPLLLRRFTEHLCLWDRLTGFPRFGCLLCWLPIT